jgi:glycosyltransferase involved in cell wall biosynthesis
VKPSLAIPIFDHPDTIALVIESLAPLQLPCIVVDDGSGKATQRELKRLAGLHSWVKIERHPRNLGRGAALRTAYRAAALRGATHVVQLDADGQHAAADVPRFLDAAKARPDALILGAPVFDGFRCVPLASTLEVLQRRRTGDRMDFDPELVIRLVRAGVPVVNIPTEVRYPEGGVSHFRMLEDNARIAWAYVRLSCELPWGRSRTSAAGEQPR